MTAKDAQKAYDLVLSVFGENPYPKEFFQPCSILSVPDLKTPLVNYSKVQVKGNSLYWLLDMGQDTPENVMLLAVLVALIKEPFYSELRTKQQVLF